MKKIIILSLFLLLAPFFYVGCSTVGEAGSEHLRAQIQEIVDRNAPNIKDWPRSEQEKFNKLYKEFLDSQR